MKKKMCVLVLTMAFAATAMTGCVKVVKTGEEAALTGAVEFNAGDNVANFWDTAMLPEMEGKAAELTDVLTLSNGDLNSLSDKDYAKYSMGDSGELTYTVKGTGIIDEVMTDKKAGYITVKLNDYSGTETIKIQIGSVFKGTSVRDSLNFIDFNDYTNQIEWGAVSQSINGLIQTNVVDPIGTDAFVSGKSVTFLGAFTVDGADEILITPTELSVN